MKSDWVTTLITDDVGLREAWSWSTIQTLLWAIDFTLYEYTLISQEITVQLIYENATEGLI